MFKRFFPPVSAILIFFLTFAAFGQSPVPLQSADLSAKDAQSSWMNVAGGSVVGEPCPTTSGFCFANDGRILTSVTEKGAILWQKPLRGKPTPYISSNEDDFIAIITGNKNLNLINPSGALVWQKTLTFEPNTSPIFGRDGRIFIKGKKDFSCFALNGIEKYNLKLSELKMIKPIEFNDGSILLFLADEKSGKTQGQRISPYGKLLETITFTSIVKETAECDDGILVALENGDCALVSIKNGEAVSSWTATLGVSEQKSSGKTPVVISSFKNNAIFILQDGKIIKTCSINIQNGSISKIFPLGDGDLSLFKNVRSTERGVFLCDGLFAREFSPDGTIFWEARLPSKKQWSNAFYSEKNYLVLCKTSWIIDAYLMSQSTTKKTASKKIKKTYNHFFEVREQINENPQFLSPLFKPNELLEVKVELENGNYGEKERDWVSRLYREFNRYKTLSMSQTTRTRQIKSYFDDNIEYTRALIETAALLGTDQFLSDLAYFLAFDKNPALRTTLLNSCGSLGFDRGNEILTAIQNLLTVKIRPAEKTQIFLACDTVYNICAFMGRPALLEKGREILSYLFYPQFDSEVREYSRKTLEKIGELKI